MAVIADNVIALAQNTKALSKEQLARILELAPKMNEDELTKLTVLLHNLQDAELKDMQAELEVRKNVAAAYKEWQADKSRTDLQKKEGAVQGQEAAHAESLIKTI